MNPQNIEQARRGQYALYNQIIQTKNYDNLYTKILIRLKIFVKTFFSHPSVKLNLSDVLPCKTSPSISASDILSSSSRFHLFHRATPMLSFHLRKISSSGLLRWPFLFLLATFFFFFDGFEEKEDEEELLFILHNFLQQSSFVLALSFS